MSIFDDNPDLQSRIDSGDLTSDEAVSVAQARKNLNSHGNFFTFDSSGNVKSSYTQPANGEIASTSKNDYGLEALGDAIQTGISSLGDSIGGGSGPGDNNGGFGDTIKTVAIALAVIVAAVAIYKLAK